MGGNLWFFGETEDAALAAAEAGVAAVHELPGRHHAVPGRHRRQRIEGGQQVQVHVREHVRKVLPAACRMTRRQTRSCPKGVGSVMEIIINGRDLNAIIDATQAAIAASVNTPGLLRISAGNYGGRLGKSFIYLHPDKQPTAPTT